MGTTFVFFFFKRKFAAIERGSEDKLSGFLNRRPAYFYHANTNHIITVGCVEA